MEDFKSILANGNMILMRREFQQNILERKQIDLIK